MKTQPEINMDLKSSTNQLYNSEESLTSKMAQREDKISEFDDKVK